MNIRLSLGVMKIILCLTFLLWGCSGGEDGPPSGGPTANSSVPSMPMSIIAIPSDNEVTIGWEAVCGATSYNLYMASVSGVNKSNYSSLADGMKHEGVVNPFTHTGLINGKTYYFVLTALNAEGESSDSSEVPASPNVSVLSNQGSFSATGKMTIARSGHTATLLLSGKVLITGGISGSSTTGYLSSSELYDPTTGTFSSTGNMATARAFHTATLLPDGKVLITGGLSNGTTGAVGLTSAEVYDPVSNTFSSAGNMTTARAGHTATTLSNCKVFITGGFNNSADLYDPATGNFSPTGNMATSRVDHTATLLPNGKVLITGGGSSITSVSDGAEVYDPVSNTFSPTGNMTTARVEHKATLLPNGKVLITGGTGIGSTAGPLASAELYDFATGTFSSIGDMAMPRYHHTATLLSNGRVLIAGGWSFNSSGVPTVDATEVYDPDSGAFSATSNMNTARAGHTATVLSNGIVLISGGSTLTTSTAGVLSSAEIFQ